METASHGNHPVLDVKTAEVRTREARDGFELRRTNVRPAAIHIHVGKKRWVVNKHCWRAGGRGGGKQAKESSFTSRQQASQVHL